jgi:hypothetical protein
MKKTKALLIRVTEHEHEAVKHEARKMKCTISEMVRVLTLNQIYDARS